MWRPRSNTRRCTPGDRHTSPGRSRRHGWRQADGHATRRARGGFYDGRVQAVTAGSVVAETQSGSLWDFPAGDSWLILANRDVSETELHELDEPFLSEAAAVAAGYDGYERAVERLMAPH